MQMHDVRVHPSKANLAREDQLAWKIAGVAVDQVAVPDDTAEMIVNRVIDNAAVAIASVNRHPCMSARDMALALAMSAAAMLLSFAVVSIASDLRYHLWAMVATTLGSVALAMAPKVPRLRVSAAAAAVAVVTAAGVIARLMLPAATR